MEIVDPFKIPGLAAREQSDAGINVLKRVFLDPRSGQLVFIGRYDPAYATGAIDYTTLLHDALRSPAPSFTLEPTPGTKSAVAGFVRQMDQQMAANLGSVETGKAWLIGIFDQLLTNPALEVDRRRFLAKGAKLFNVKPEEVPALMQAMLGRPERASPLYVNFWVKFYQSLGAPEAAGYIWAVAHKDSDPQAFRDSLDRLGLTPVLTDVLSRIQSGTLSDKTGDAIMEVEIWAAIHQLCKIPESRWRAAVDRARRTGDIDTFRAFKDDLNANILREHAMEPWLNGLVFSETFLQVMQRMPSLESVPVYREGLQPDSELARTFLAADWMLKTLSVTPELAERVPGHLTPTQFAFQRETAQNVYDLGNVEARFWLTPESVALRSDPAGTVLDFGEARTSVRSEILAHSGGSAAADRLMRESTAAYGREVTRRYDEYARALTPLHQLREAAKILALVHWAQARGLKLVPPGPAAPARALPASFHQGFWTAFFLFSPEKSYFGLAASGGVDFGQSAGGAWVQTREDATLGSTALQQLAGSAALGQQAADAALRGDLELARSLADQSARAMTGDFDLSAHPKLGTIPEVPPPDRVTQVELQNELVTQNTRAIAVLVQASSAPGPIGETQRAQAQEHIRQIQGLLASDAPPPAQARQWVKLLRNEDWAALPASKTRPQTVATAPPVSAPVVVAAAGPIITPPTGGACTATLSPTEAVPGEHKTFLNNKLAEARNRLRYINEALKKLMALNASQRAEIDKLTAEITKDYEAAKERAYDFAVSTLVDLPLAKYADIHDERVRAMENLIKGQIGLSTTAMSDSARKAVEYDIMQMSALKERYNEAFVSTQRLLDLYAGAGYGKDIYKWDEGTRNAGDFKRGLDAATLAAKILLDHPYLKTYLSTKDWFGGNKLWQVFAMGKMAGYASDFFWDIMNQYVAWAPLAASLGKDLQFNAQAMEQLRLKAQKASQEIDCLERLVQK